MADRFAIVVDGTERARLARGEFFGEVSIILGESPIADVVAVRPLRQSYRAKPGLPRAHDRSGTGEAVGERLP